ncbi:hypothetical protein AOQ84DRAFT_383527 [Glonium stellatum]|uniref:Uncharacterized protein n=1 Tax=Glonium stellatum TaxID=574774 RepID=A0A8E2EMU0_9PEZI|nr:hypothetical protein AOQ84DRAFT_383527 [Glonium stellatum]
MKFRLWPFLVLCSSTLASPLLEKRHSYSFVGCDSGQQNAINEILDDMEALATAAVKNSESGAPSAAFTAWFGDGTGQKISNENINTRFHKISIFKTSVPKKDVAFDCTEQSPCCKSGAGAVPACALDVVDTVKDEFGKTFTGRGYGQEVCLRYALKNPVSARRNADTHTLFATASYYGIGNWQTDPNKLN